MANKAVDSDVISPSKPPRNKRARKHTADMAGIHKSKESDQESSDKVNKQSKTDTELLQEQVAELIERQQQIEADMYDDDDGMSANIAENKAVLDELLTEVGTLREKNKDQDEVIQRLLVVISKNNETMESMRGEIDDMKNRMLSTNVLVHNVPEREDKNLEHVMREELRKSGYNIGDVVFKKVWRLGQKRNDIRPRTVVAVPSNPNRIPDLLATSIPRDKKQKMAWISPQYT